MSLGKRFRPRDRPVESNPGDSSELEDQLRHRVQDENRLLPRLERIKCSRENDRLFLGIGAHPTTLL